MTHQNSAVGPTWDGNPYPVDGAPHYIRGSSRLVEGPLTEGMTSSRNAALGRAAKILVEAAIRIETERLNTELA
jgi:hypothetical protein